MKICVSELLIEVTKMIGDVLESGTLADERRGLKAVHAGHGHIEQDHGEILLAAGTCRASLPELRAHQVLVKGRQARFQREQLVGPIIHDQDIDLVLDGIDMRAVGRDALALPAA